MPRGYHEVTARLLPARERRKGATGDFCIILTTAPALKNHLKTGDGCPNGPFILPVRPHFNPLPKEEGTFEIVSKCA